MPAPDLGESLWGSVIYWIVMVVIPAGVIIGLVLRILGTVEQTIKLLTVVQSIYELLGENSLAVLEVLICVCTSALPRGTLSTCRSDTLILGSGHVRLYPLDTVAKQSKIKDRACHTRD